MAYSSKTTGGINKCRIFKVAGAVPGTISYADLVAEFDYQTSVSETNSIKLGSDVNSIVGKSGFEVPLESTQDNKVTWEAIQPYFNDQDAPAEGTYVDNSKFTAGGAGTVQLFMVLYGGVSGDNDTAVYYGTCEITGYASNGIIGGQVVLPTVTFTSFANNYGALTLDADIWTSNGTLAIVKDDAGVTPAWNVLPVTHAVDNAVAKDYYQGA